MLDLTPNYLGSTSWFTPVKDDLEKLKVGLRNGSVGPSRLQRSTEVRFSVSPQAAAEYWLGLGVDGIKVSDLTVASDSADWSKLQAAVQTNSSQDGKKR